MINVWVELKIECTDCTHVTAIQVLSSVEPSKVQGPACIDELCDRIRVMPVHNHGYLNAMRCRKTRRT